MTEKKQLTFKISTALKDIIGKDLIRDKYIAIFELVKNSYDAGAQNVTITFNHTSDQQSIENAEIIISDDGWGMDYQDIIDKWLFVAFSEKKPKNRERIYSEMDYRNRFKRNVAGSKGVGRFSCDRLGSQLTLITKKEEEKFAHQVIIDWKQFEIDDSEEFAQVNLQYEKLDSFPRSRGTTLVINQLREVWDRDSILTLKKSLMKLINPDFVDNADPFFIFIEAEEEKEADENLFSKGEENNNEYENLKVNGQIKNDVFEKLDLKTTNLKVTISEDGSQIQTVLTDGGELIYNIVEKNRKYPLLHNIEISVFYLNRKAKVNFTKLMGIEPVNYGSVFVYKNGFRIYPYGEPGSDIFNINQRKAQGYNRFLGTREIIGRVSIFGENEKFIETSSRAHGFIENSTVQMLTSFFIAKILPILERYVVNIINWGEPLKFEINSEFSSEVIKDKIITEFSFPKNDIIEMKWNDEIFIQRLNSNSGSIPSTIKKLEEKAIQSNDKDLQYLTSEIKTRTDGLLKENIELEKGNRLIEEHLDKAIDENKIKERQLIFLRQLSNKDAESLVLVMHTISTTSEALHLNLKTLRKLLNSEKIDTVKINKIFSNLFLDSHKIRKYAHLSINETQSLKGTYDVFTFIEQYIKDPINKENGLKYNIQNENNQSYVCTFEPTFLAIIFDNLSNNSIKAHANTINISLTKKRDFTQISFKDNGMGLNQHTNPDMLFDLGTTTTADRGGSGIGLYHVKYLVNDMGGHVKINTNYKDGFELVVCLRNES